MSVVFKSVVFEWPNGQALFWGLDLALEPGRKYGLIGPNGAGKSTLARLALGELAPASGHIKRAGRISRFAQSETPPDASVGEYLGDLWGGVASADSATAARMLGGLSFEVACSTLSGGEWTKVRLLKLLATGADFFVLDEPTNNLDRPSRESVLEFVRLTRRGLLIIAHDRELLGEVDAILELSQQGLAVFGGGWALYEQERVRERARLAGALDQASRERDRASLEKEEKLRAQDKRMRRGQKSAEKSGIPKILLGARKRQAQKTLGKIRSGADDALAGKVDAAREAFERQKTDPVIYADFPKTALPASKLVFEARELNFRYEGMERDLWRRNINFRMSGPSRLAVSGRNGSGKTTLLNLLTGFKKPVGLVSGSLKLGGLNCGFVDQRADLLDEDRTVLENVWTGSRLSEVEVRNLLAQFLFQGEKALQRAATLSGGERLRACLAKTLIADPAPQLLILDEPTNNLDMVNLEFLEAALARFEGALIVISHDRSFLQGVGVTDELSLD